jgi:hypothetical protein
MTTEPRRSARIANLKKKNEVSEVNTIHLLKDLATKNHNAKNGYERFSTVLRVLTAYTEHSYILAKYPTLRNVFQKKILTLLSTIYNKTYITNKEKLQFFCALGKCQLVLLELPSHPQYVPDL